MTEADRSAPTGAVFVLGCRVDAVDADEATRRILEMAASPLPSQVVTLGTEMVVYAQRDAVFRAIVNSCALALCDTVGLLAVARKRGAVLRDRVTGVELIDHICAAAAPAGVPVFLLGGSEGGASEAAATLQARYPGLHVAGARNGYFGESESANVAAEIRASGARVLFAGLGSPRQELWLSAHLPATGVGVGIGVGGSLDVASGRVRRAPRAFRRLHLEWLYRLLKEPRRWRRQLALPRFVLLAAAESARLRKLEKRKGKVAS